jgi:hypothetical protein
MSSHHSSIRARRYTHDTKKRGVLAARNLDIALQAHHGNRIETALREPGMIGVGIAAAKGDQMLPA